MFKNLQSLFSNKPEFSPIDPYVLVEQNTIQQVQQGVTGMLNRIQSEKLINGIVPSSARMLSEYLKVFQGTCNLFGAVGGQQIVLGGVQLPSGLLKQSDELSGLIPCWEESPAMSPETVSQVYEYLINYDQRIPFAALPDAVQKVVRAYYAASALMSADDYNRFRQRDLATFRARMLSSLCYYFPAVTLEPILRMAWDPVVFCKYTCGYTQDFVYKQVRPMVAKMSQLLKTQITNPNSLSAKMRPLIVAVVNNCVAYWSGKGFPQPEFSQGQPRPQGYIPNSVADKTLIHMFQETLVEYKEISEADKEFIGFFLGEFDGTKWGSIPGLQSSIAYLMGIIELCQIDTQEQELTAGAAMAGKSKAAGVFAAAAASFSKKLHPDRAENFTSKFTDAPEGPIDENDIFNVGKPVKPPKRGNLVPPQEFGRIVSGWIQMSGSNPSFGIGIKVTNKAGAMFGNRTDYCAGFEVMGVAPEDMDEELQADINEFLASASKLIQKNQRSLRSSEPTYLIVFPTSAIMGPPIQIDLQTGLSIVQQSQMSAKYYHLKAEQVRRASEASRSRRTQKESTRGTKRGASQSDSTGRPGGDPCIDFEESSSGRGSGVSAGFGAGGTSFGSSSSEAGSNEDISDFFDSNFFGSDTAPSAGSGQFDDGMNYEKGPVSLGASPIRSQTRQQARSTSQPGESSRNSVQSSSNQAKTNPAVTQASQGTAQSGQTTAQSSQKSRGPMTVASTARYTDDYKPRRSLEDDDPELADKLASKSGFGAEADKALEAGKNIAAQLRASLSSWNTAASDGAKAVAETKTEEPTVETISLFADEVSKAEEESRKQSSEIDKASREKTQSVGNDLADFMRASAGVADSLRVSHMVEARLSKFLGSYDYAIREVKAGRVVSVDGVHAAEGNASPYLDKFMEVLRKASKDELSATIESEYRQFENTVKSVLSSNDVKQVKEYLLEELFSTFDMLKSEVLGAVKM